MDKKNTVIKDLQTKLNKTASTKKLLTTLNTKARTKDRFSSETSGNMLLAGCSRFRIICPIHLLTHYVNKWKRRYPKLLLSSHTKITEQRKHCSISNTDRRTVVFKILTDTKSVQSYMHYQHLLQFFLIYCCIGITDRHSQYTCTIY